MIFYIYYIKTNTIKDPSLDSRFDLDTSFIIIFREESKAEQWVPCKIGEEIAFILLEKFFDSLDYIEENIVRWLFEMKDLIGKISKGTHI